MLRPDRIAYGEGVIRPISRFALTLDIVGAALLFLILTPISMAFYAPTASPGSIPLMLLSSVLMFGGVAIGRLAPALALIAAWAGAIVQMASGLAPLPTDLAVLLVLYATAAWGSRTVMWWGLGSAVGGSVIAAIYLIVVNGVVFGAGSLWDIINSGIIMLALVGLSLGFSWVLGLLWRQMLRSRSIHLARVEAEKAAAEEQERVRIARDMHDIVAHSLAVVIAQADGARYAAAADPHAAQQALGTIATTARGALSDVRMLLTQLRHRQGDGPQPTLADLETLFAQVRQAGVELRVTVDPVPPGEPPGAIQLAVFRVLQEALTNALRHGTGSDAVEVRLAWLPDCVELEVRNATAAPGSGGAAQVGETGHGLIGMRERAQLVGGTLQAERDGAQFVVRAALPIGVSA